MEGLVVCIIQIDILNIHPTLWLRFGSVFMWLVFSYGEGVRTLLAGAVIEH